jgi:quercetin dioxygenase-like cupin family protein
LETTTAPAPKVTRTDRLVAPLGERALEIVGYEVHLAAGTEAAPHRHGYSTMARVLDGVFRYKIGDGPMKDYAAGDVFSEPAGVPVTGLAVTPVTLYVVLVRQPGEPEARPCR